MSTLRTPVITLTALALSACGLPGLPGTPPPATPPSGLVLTVVSAASVGNVSGVSPGDGEGFIAVQVKLANGTQVSEPIGLPTFRARRASGIETPASLTTTTSDPCAEPAFLSPGATVECALVFSVPLTDSVTQIVYAPDGNASAASAKVPAVALTPGCAAVNAGQWDLNDPMTGPLSCVVTVDACTLHFASFSGGVPPDLVPDAATIAGNTVTLTKGGAPWQGCTGTVTSAFEMQGQCASTDGFESTWSAQHQ